MFLTTCTLLPPTFIQPHTRNHSLTRLGLYILTDTQHQIILLFTSPTRLRTDTHHTGGAGGGAEQLPHTHKGQASESSESALPGSLTRARARVIGLGLLGLGLLGLGLIGLGLIGLGLARVRFWHGLRVRVRVMARVSHAHSAHNPSNPS